jgi:hypothetical protein
MTLPQLVGLERGTPRVRHPAPRVRGHTFGTNTPRTAYGVTPSFFAAYGVTPSRHRPHVSNHSAYGVTPSFFRRRVRGHTFRFSGTRHTGSHLRAYGVTPSRPPPRVKQDQTAATHLSLYGVIPSFRTAKVTSPQRFCAFTVGRRWVTAPLSERKGGERMKLDARRGFATESGRACG